MSYGNGGSIYITGSSAQTLTMISNAITTSSSYNGKGGLMYVDNSVQNLQISTLIANDIKAKDTGGAFMFENINTVNIDTNSQFQRLGPSSFGSLIYSINPTLDLTIASTTVKCKDLAFNYASDLQAQIESVNPVGYSKGLFFLANMTSDIISNTNVF